ncbi:MAG: TonB-dependent receptor [Bacteroidales bacterium]|nr:TonB-dependent receptor [Bacteroidales bacterium]
MFKAHIISILFLLSLFQFMQAQKKPGDANLLGHVVSQGRHIPFANVAVKGTTIGTVTDETSHFHLFNLPVGEQTIAVSVIGYKPREMPVHLKKQTTAELKFELEEDIMNLEEVVVSADRSEQKRTEAPVIVNTIGSQIFRSTQSQTLGEGFNFSPGLRLENNCQNCGFSQVRMNGMEGAYSQILINSRPIFSGLAGVYGLELIPSNMVKKIEVVRGGGSALFGSNAIAGTIKIILRDPVHNSYQAGASYAQTGVGVEGSGGNSADYSITFNTSVVSDDRKSGLSLYGFSRKREIFDANKDSFSELAPLENLTFGARAFHRFGNRDKLTLDFFAINEERDGGNMQDYPEHERDIAEAVEHRMKVAGITYERYLRDYDLLSFYTSGQFLDRDSYYGAEQSLNGYGNSRDKTYNLGVQYKAVVGNSSLVSGIENTSGFLLDKKLGYPDWDRAVISGDNKESIPHTQNTVIADQSSLTTGVFVQYDLKLNKFKAALGARFDHYAIKDLVNEDKGSSKGTVFSPRISLMYRLLESLQGRLSYSQGYRAPQIFDEDLHIETSGSRQVVHENALDLRQETSHSIMASLDYNRQFGRTSTGLLVEAFYTRLEDAFANEYGSPDEGGTVIYTRVNAEGRAWVNGINMEFKLRPSGDFDLSSGFTLQNREFEKAQEFEETHFFRSPDSYGFLALDWDFARRICLSGTGTYTGKMLVPYFGTENPEGELRTSDPFFDLGLKLAYTAELNGASVEFSGGIKNVFNSYQDDFDKGINRDPAYLYGPISPQTVFIGIRFGKLQSRDGIPSVNSKQGSVPGRGKSTRSERRKQHRGNRPGRQNW